jgi:uncharacterized cysteine cluster protein YcgN (CxxCxxCC family)
MKELVGDEVFEYAKKFDKEQICEKCGRCCIIKRDVGRGFSMNTSKTCEYLNDGLCSIYDEKVNNHGITDGNVCLSAKQAFINKLLPNDCPYVKYYGKGKRYTSRVINN